MLGHLARYLRAAGYDTTLASGGTRDRDLLAQARVEHRVFLTCDRRIAEHNAAREVAIILPRGGLDDTAGAVSRALDIHWLHAPFTRCIVDNTPLGAVPEALRGALPSDVKTRSPRFCPRCKRVYWAGSHTARMQRRLASWSSGHFAHAPSNEASL